MEASVHGSALVTGAGSGIGAATARALARAGRAVVVADVVGERAAAVAAELAADGARALAVTVDVRDDAAVRALVQQAVQAFGPFAVVCPNAGVAFRERPLEETTDEMVDALLGVNLRGAIHTLRAAVPHVVEGGCVVITSSVSGLQAHPGAAVYAATKLALVGLARSLASELAARRIRVNCVCPGGVDTPLLGAIYGDAIEAVVDEYHGLNPLGRIATPDDVAEAIAFLASPAARHITGVALRVDGGDTLGGAL